MPFSALDGIGLGSAVEVGESNLVAYPSEAWLGRVINAFGEPLDEKGPIDRGGVGYPVKRAAPPAHARGRVDGKIDLGVKSLNAFVTCCRGQRMGVFSASGVGKSILMSMLARNSQADVIVIGLVGERGREVKEFVEEDLGAEGLARSVLVVATSDESPLMRRQAAYMTMTVAEYFRDQGRDVLCLMDSVTRLPWRSAKSVCRPENRPRARAIRRRFLPSSQNYWNVRDRAQGKERLLRCLRCWSRATITTNPSRMRSAALSMATSFWTGRSRSGAVIRRSIF